MNLRNFYTTSFLLSALLLSTSAQASGPGYFATFNVGGTSSDSDNAKNRGTNQANGPSGGYEVESDSVVGLGVGYHFGNGFRIQGEWRYREQETDNSPQAASANGNIPGNTFSVDGQVETNTLMVNAFYDFPSSNPRFKPYVKAGIGAALHDTEATLDIRPLFDNVNPGAIGSDCPNRSDRFCYPDDDNSEFAWAVGFGANYELTPQWDLGLDYQYIDMGETATGVDNNGDYVEFEQLTDHELTVGLTYTF